MNDTAPVRPPFRVRAGRFAESAPVQRVIMLLIVLNGISLGLETADSVMAEWGPYLLAFDKAVLVVFVLEIAAKLGYRRWTFFRNGWNVFDFIIVAIALMPAAGPLAVLRSLRVLRVLRLLSMVPQMRRVISALLAALPGMLTVGAIILLFFYIGAVLSTKLFGDGFDDWFGTVGRSMYTLFQIMTLESWSMGIVRPVMEVYPYAWMFFVPFIVATSFAVLNLFIGIIVDAMQIAAKEEERIAREKEEAEAAARAEAGKAREASEPRSAALGGTFGDLADEIRALRAEVRALKDRLPQ